MSSNANVYIAVQLVPDMKSPHGLLLMMVLSLASDEAGLGDLLCGVFSSERAIVSDFFSFVSERL